jgi:hypothetical protein
LVTGPEIILRKGAVFRFCEVSSEKKFSLKEWGVFPAEGFNMASHCKEISMLKKNQFSVEQIFLSKNCILFHVAVKEITKRNQF